MEEMKKVRGKIEWIAAKPNEFQGQLQFSIKVNGQFYNFHETEEKLIKLATRLKKGYEVELSVELNIIRNIEVISDKVEAAPEQRTAQGRGSFQDQLERVNYKTLEDQAHKIGLVKMEVEFVSELSDVSKMTACFKATATIATKKIVSGREEITYKVYEDFGDACGLEENAGGNIEQKTIRNAWIRMASTRAQVRALKQATNNMEVAAEELPSGTIEDAETKPEKEVKVDDVEADKVATEEAIVDAIVDDNPYAKPGLNVEDIKIADEKPKASKKTK